MPTELESLLLIKKYKNVCRNLESKKMKREEKNADSFQYLGNTFIFQYYAAYVLGEYHLDPWH